MHWHVPSNSAGDQLASRHRSQSSEIHLRTNPPRINGDRRRILHSSFANDSQPVQCTSMCALDILHHLRYDSLTTFLPSLYPEQDFNYPDSPPVFVERFALRERYRDSYISSDATHRHYGTVITCISPLILLTKTLGPNSC